MHEIFVYLQLYLSLMSSSVVSLLIKLSLKRIPVHYIRDIGGYDGVNIIIQNGLQGENEIITK